LPVVFADERCGEPVPGVDKIVAETALDAQAALVRQAVLDAGHPHYPFSLDMKVKLAADTTVRAGRADLVGLVGTPKTSCLPFC